MERRITCLPGSISIRGGFARGGGVRTHSIGGVEPSLRRTLWGLQQQVDESCGPGGCGPMPVSIDSVIVVISATWEERLTMAFDWPCLSH